jgi:adenylate cyclase
MAIKEDITSEISSVISTPWNVTDGTAVPDTTDIALQGGGRKLDVVMLYTDLAQSTALVTYDRRMAAKVFKAFLGMSTRLIRHNGGYIRSFDGDRVMGVFVGGTKNTDAVRTALQVKWAFDEILVPKFQAQYDKLKDGSLVLGYSTGIASGEVLVVRAGIRGSNDLLWVGRAANIAAKLSDIRYQNYRSFITETVYKNMKDETKVSNGKNMWTEFKPYGDIGAYYGSTWRWPL